jgi:hypothetical protein
MGLAGVKKELKKLDKGKLIGLIADLYQKNKSVREFFDFYVQPDEEKLFRKYRARVYEAFYPKRGYKHNLKAGKQAISDFKKLGPSAGLLASLMLSYVETGVRFTNEFGDIDENFYSSLESTWAAVLKLMKKEGLLDAFAERAAKVVQDADGIGWGFHYYIAGVYSEYFADFLNDASARGAAR